MGTRPLASLALVVLGVACSGGAGGGGAGGGGGGGGTGGSATGVGSVQFPPGSLPDGVAVQVTSVADAAALAAFDQDGVVYEPTARASHLVRVTTASAIPAADGVAVLDVPAGLSAGAGQTIVALMRIPTGNDEETHDDFQPLVSMHDAAAGKVTVLLPPIAFTANRTGGTQEALLLLVTVPAPAAPFAAPFAAPGQGCVPGKRLRPPVQRPLVLTSALSPDRSVTVNGVTRNGHPGIDLRAATGDPVLAPRTGTVLASYTSDSYGETIVLKTDVGNIRVAHLSSRGVAAGAAVTQGETLGAAGTTGFSTAPHLHFEWVNGQEKLDGWPCFLPHDYAGQAHARVEVVVDGSGTIVSTADAAVRFGFVDALDAWNVTGDVTATYLLTAPDCGTSLSGSQRVAALDGTLALELGPQGTRSYPCIAQHAGAGGSLVTVSGTTTCNDSHTPEALTVATAFAWMGSAELQPTQEDGGTLAGSTHRVDTAPTGSTTTDSSWSLGWVPHPAGAP